MIMTVLAKMIASDKLLVRFVEGDEFRNLMSVACPRFKIPSRWTVSRDIFNIYVEEILNLKKKIKLNCQRVCLTTNSWTSFQRINYVCITAHFIDNEWKLHKKVVVFVPISSYRGEFIAKVLEKSLLEWSQKNIFTVTLDNASSNDTAMSFFKRKLLSWGSD